MARWILLGVALVFGFASTVWAAGSTSTSVQPQPSGYDLGVKAVKAGDYEQAIVLLKKVVAKKPNHSDALNYLGFSYRELGQTETSLKYYEKVLAINPDHKGANEYLGELYLKDDQLDLAKKQLERLDKICASGCNEFNDLKQAIKAYEVRKASG